REHCAESVRQTVTRREGLGGLCLRQKRGPSKTGQASETGRRYPNARNVVSGQPSSEGYRHMRLCHYHARPVRRLLEVRAQAGGQAMKTMREILADAKPVPSPAQSALCCAIP